MTAERMKEYRLGIIVLEHIPLSTTLPFLGTFTKLMIMLVFCVNSEFDPVRYARGAAAVRPEAVTTNMCSVSP